MSKPKKLDIYKRLSQLRLATQKLHLMPVSLRITTSNCLELYGVTTGGTEILLYDAPLGDGFESEGLDIIEQEIRDDLAVANEALKILDE